MWIVTAIFQQSYTVFVAMVIIPYTRKSWRVWGAFLFILTAWWVYSWAWFSISGLLLADVIMNMGFREKSKAGISLGPIRFPAWPLYILVMAAGWIMQFIWVAALPELANEEIKYHTGLYDTGGLYTWNDPNNPQLRADIYLIIIGFWLLLETFAWMRAIFANPVFRFLGERSFCKTTFLSRRNGITDRLFQRTSSSSPSSSTPSALSCARITWARTWRTTRVLPALRSSPPSLSLSLLARCSTGFLRGRPRCLRDLCLIGFGSEEVQDWSVS